MLFSYSLPQEAGLSLERGYKAHNELVASVLDQVNPQHLDPNEENILMM